MVGSRVDILALNLDGMFSCSAAELGLKNVKLDIDGTGEANSVGLNS